MKSIYVILTILKKEFRQITRSRQMMALLLIVPIVQLIVLGFAFNTDVRNIPLAIIDYDQTPLTRDLYKAIYTSDKFILPKVSRISTPEELLLRGSAQIVVVIPPNFTQDLVKLQKPQLQLIIDGVDGNSARIAMSYVQTLLMQWFETNRTKIHFNFTSQEMIAEYSLQMKGSISIRERLWYNPELKSTNFMIPGIIAILLTITSMLLSSMSIVKEKEIGTLEQLMVTPVTKAELIAGKLIPFWLLSYFELMFAMLVAYVVFGITTAGSIWGLAFCSGLFLFTTLGLGMVLSIISGTQQQAMFFSWFCMVFMLLLSGLFIPVRNMPVFIQSITAINPLFYFVTILREIVQKGSSIVQLRHEIIILGTIGVLTFFMGVFNFSKKL